MQLNEALDIYNELYLKVFAVSATLFLLYSIINLIEMNKYIKDFNILNIEETSRGRFIYSYMAGYFMFVLKVILALVTLFILLLIIRVAIATLISVFTAINKKKQKGGASTIADSLKTETLNKVEQAVSSNMRLILGFVTTKPFIIIFLVIVPIFLFFVLLAYSTFYNPEHIQEVNKDESGRIMLTHHGFLVFLISSLFTIAFIYSIYLWFKMTYKL